MKGTYFSPLVWRNSVLAAAEMAASVGGQVILYYFMARRFGPSSFGIVTLAATIVATTGLLVTFGSVTHGIRTIAAGNPDSRSVPGLLLSFQWTNAAVILPILALAVWAWPTSLTERVFVLIMLAAIPADCVAGVVRANFYGRERFMPPTALNAVSSLAVLGVGLIYLHAGASLIEMGIIEATIAWARAAAGLDMHRRLIGPLLPARPAAAYAAITRPAFPFFLTFVLTTVHTRSAVVIVRWLCGQEQLGLYGVAASAIGAAVATMLPLGTSLFPSVAQQTALTNGLYPRRALFTLLPPMAAGIAGAAGITLSAGFLVRTFLDVSFAESVFPLRLLSWMLPSAFISSMAMRMLLASGRATTAIRILALNCAVNIAANLTFVPLIGINGAALAGVVSASAGALQSVLALARGRRPGARCLDLGS